LEEILLAIHEEQRKSKRRLPICGRLARQMSVPTRTATRDSAKPSRRSRRRPATRSSRRFTTLRQGQQYRASQRLEKWLGPVLLPRRRSALAVEKHFLKPRRLGQLELGGWAAGPIALQRTRAQRGGADLFVLPPHGLPSSFSSPMRLLGLSTPGCSLPRLDGPIGAPGK
jgi:hypothetical protein